MKRFLTAVTVSVAIALLPAVAGAAPITGGAGAEYGEHVSSHAGAEGGFTGQMNPGDHQGFAGFDEHH